MDNAATSMMQFGGYGQPMMQYGGMPPQPKFSNTLTNEEMEKLRKKQNEFSLSITEDERLRAICNHRSADGMNDTLVQEPDGTVVCTTCGYRFKPVSRSLSKESITEVIEDINNILQTIKLLYADFPVEAAREYFLISPMLEKIPQLFDYAAKSFQKYEQTTNGYYNYNSSQSATQALNNLGALFGMGGFGAMQPNPMMGAVPQMAGAAPVQGNPFGFNGASMMGGYQPQTNGFQYQPGSQPVTPQPNPAAQPQTTTAKVDVQA